MQPSDRLPQLVLAIFCRWRPAGGASEAETESCAADKPARGGLRGTVESAWSLGEVHVNLGVVGVVLWAEAKRASREVVPVRLALRIWLLHTEARYAGYVWL